MRHAINLMQATASLGGITEENVISSAGLTKTSDVDEVLKIALSGKVPEAREKMIELIKVYGMSESDFLKYINSAVFKSKHEKLADILEIIAKYDYRVLVGANSEIQLSAMLAELLIGFCLFVPKFRLYAITMILVFHTILFSFTGETFGYFRERNQGQRPMMVHR